MPKIEVNGANIDYDIYGRGKPLLLVHGFSCSKDTWKNQIPEFSKYYQVITMSQRGHGDSDKPVGEDNYSVTALASDIHTLLNKLNIVEKVNILGHSFGAKVTMQFCLRHLDQINTVILFGSKLGPRQSGQSSSPTLEDSIRDIREKGLDSFMSDHVKFWFSPNADPEFVKANSSDSHKLPAHTALSILQLSIAVDFTDRISALNVPSLVIVGEQDQPCPIEDSEKVNRLLPDSWLKIIKGASHMAHIEKPESFNQAVLRFLNSFAQHSGSKG